MKPMIEFLTEDFDELNIYLKQKAPSLLLIIVDENTHEHCLPRFLPNLETEIPFEIIELEAGEEQKTLDTVSNLLLVFAELQADRNTLVINLGGGVITDLGGFSASIFKRGIDFINIPTSLLGMCDASLGGKTGVDLEHLKNFVGTFALPEKVFVDVNFLKTLPKAELVSGFAEMLKHGLVSDQPHWKNLIELKEITPENIAPYIKDSMRIKQNIVDHDFYEKNIRKILNFGHTIGHAIESSFLKAGNPISHGQSIAIGMICETRLSFLENLISVDTSNEIIFHIKKYFSPRDFTFANKDILALMKNDKKNHHSKIQFSLVDKIGSCLYDINCSEENILDSLNYYKNNFPL